MTLGKSSGSAPQAPDPVVTANAQTASNIETARKNAELNRVNQYTPQGSTVYSRTNTAPWDEAAYLAANPDVAEAVRLHNSNPDAYQRGVKSGQEHYLSVGRTEGRTGAPAGFGDDQWQATTTYSPEQQRLYDLSTQAQTMYGETGLAQLGKLREQMSTPFQLSGAPDYQQVGSRAGQIQTTLGPDDYPADRARVEEALYSRLNPSMEQQRTALEARLRSQGLAPGSEAWTNAMRSQAQSETDARLGVTAQGLQEQQGLFGMALSRGQFGNQSVAQQQNMDMASGQYGQGVRQQMLAEQLAIRNQPLNETSALLTGQQVQAPQFGAVPQTQVAPTDVMGAYNTQYQGQLAAYQGNVATNNANTGAAAGVGAAAITAAAVIA